MLWEIHYRNKAYTQNKKLRIDLYTFLKKNCINIYCDYYTKTIYKYVYKNINCIIPYHVHLCTIFPTELKLKNKLERDSKLVSTI